MSKPRSWDQNPVLDVKNLTLAFGGLLAIDDLSFKIGRRDITAIIGPNGAGKTTVFNCLTGFYKPDRGDLSLTHEDGAQYRLEKMAEFRINNRARVARTFQNIRLFTGMSVLENLLVAQHHRLMRSSGLTIGALLGLGSYRSSEHQALELSKYWLDKTGLLNRADDLAGDLPYGDQRRLEIARAMCTRPFLLCLDEPAAGLNPKESNILSELLLEIKHQEDIAILLIEHDMSLVMGISDHIVVLDYGRKISDGAPSFVRNDPNVIAAYLGVDETGEVIK